MQSIFMTLTGRSLPTVSALHREHPLIFQHTMAIATHSPSMPPQGADHLQVRLYSICGGTVKAHISALSPK